MEHRIEILGTSNMVFIKDMLDEQEELDSMKRTAIPWSIFCLNKQMQVGGS